MGSKEIWNLEYRDSFSFIAKNGEKDSVNEKRGKEQTNTKDPTLTR